MYQINTIALSGIIGTEPVVKPFKENESVVRFRIAQTQPKKQQDGTYADVSMWLDVYAFGKDEWCRGIKKGQRVVVQGELYNNDYKAQDGTNRTSYAIKASYVFKDVQNTQQKTQQNPKDNNDECPF